MARRSFGPGVAAGFPAGKTDGHHLINRTDCASLHLESAPRDDEAAH
jgi:uncharacterized cupin superfamily protein